MKTILVILFAVSLALAGCAPAATSDGDLPTNPETPGASGSPYSPQPGDEKLSRGAAYISSVDLLTMESFPLQFSLALKGELPTPCNQLRIQVAPPNAQKIIDVQVYSVVDPQMACTQVLEHFEVNVPLGSFPSGHYEVLVNDGQAAEFDA